MDDSPRLRKLFSEGSNLRPKVATDLLTAMGFYSSIIPDSMLPGRTSGPHSPPARLKGFHDVSSAAVISAHVPRVTALPSSAPERSARMLPPVSEILTHPSRVLIIRPGVSRRSGGLCESRSSPGSAFLSVLEYNSRFRNQLDGQRFAAIPVVSSLHGRSTPFNNNQ